MELTDEDIKLIKDALRVKIGVAEWQGKAPKAQKELLKKQEAV